MGERGFWQQSYDEESWENHADNVKGLLTQLVGRFPAVHWDTEPGAITGERLHLTERREGPDITGWSLGHHFVSIEVSGTPAKVTIPPDPILVRPGKLRSVVPLLFWMVYRDVIYVLHAEDVEKYHREVIQMKKSGKFETYLAVPYWEGHAPEYLFQVISSLLPVIGR